MIFYHQPPGLILTFVRTRQQKNTSTILPSTTTSRSTSDQSGQGTLANLSHPSHCGRHGKVLRDTEFASRYRTAPQRLIMMQCQIVSLDPFTKLNGCVCKFPLLRSYILLRRLGFMLSLYRILRSDGRENSEHNSFEGTSPLSSNLHDVCVKFW